MEPCASCGSQGSNAFDAESFAISHCGVSVMVKGLAGWRCRSCGEVVLDKISARRYAAAGDELVLGARRYA